MKYLVLLLIPNLALAQNYMGLTDIQDKINGNRGITVYRNQAACEARESEECLDITGIDLEVYDLTGNVLTINASKDAAKQAAIVQRQQDRADRRNRIRDARDNFQSLTPAQRNQAIRDLLETITRE